jgi:cyclophilin family peptidyl-prolyl cis-trans isomerase
MKILQFTVLIVLLISCYSSSYSNLDDGLYADIQTDKGSILVQLNYEDTPITVANFVSLAEGTNKYVAKKFKGKPFYDGLKFHRVKKDFLIQGGDPLGTGRGSPGYIFEDEFPTNDDANLLLPHDKAGVLSMANSGPDTNGSQFFITQKEMSILNGVHSVFGHVISGQQVVDIIAKGDVMNTIEIIRIGDAAKKFNASRVFSDYFKSLEKEAKNRKENIKQAKFDFLKLLDKAKHNSVVMLSGLKIYFINKKEGKKPRIGSKVNVFYAGYFETGELFDSNRKEIAKLHGKYSKKREERGGYKPVVMDYSPDATLISGFKEGLRQMRVGDKAILFIPSHLAYGTHGHGQIVLPNTDLIFELEIVE